MSKASLLIGLFLISFSLGSQAGGNEKSAFSLSLQCMITFSDFDDIEHLTIIENIKLTEIKHKPGGQVLIAETGGYEFWAMVHGVQAINDRLFINNFQVAIKHKDSLLFMHALSDNNHSADDLPVRSRISLVEYHPNSAMEKGELMLECTRQLQY